MSPNRGIPSGTTRGGTSSNREIPSGISRGSTPTNRGAPSGATRGSTPTNRGTPSGNLTPSRGTLSGTARGGDSSRSLDSIPKWSSATGNSGGRGSSNGGRGSDGGRGSNSGNNGHSQGPYHGHYDRGGSHNGHDGNYYGGGGYYHGRGGYGGRYYGGFWGYPSFNQFYFGLGGFGYSYFGNGFGLSIGLPWPRYYDYYNVAQPYYVASYAQPYYADYVLPVEYPITLPAEIPVELPPESIQVQETSFTTPTPGESDDVNNSAVIAAVGNAGEYQALAEQAFRERRYEDAARLSNHALIEDGENGKLHLFASQVFFALGDYGSAAAAIQRGASLLDRSEWGFVVENFKKFYQGKDYVTQMDELVKFTKDNPDLPYLYFLRGYHYLYLGHKEAARAPLTKAIELESRDRLAAELLVIAGGQVPETTPEEAIPADTPPAETTPADVPSREGNPTNQTRAGKPPTADAAPAITAPAEVTPVGPASILEKRAPETPSEETPPRPSKISESNSSGDGP